MRRKHQGSSWCSANVRWLGSLVTANSKHSYFFLLTQSFPSGDQKHCPKKRHHFHLFRQLKVAHHCGLMASKCKTSIKADKNIGYCQRENMQGSELEREDLSKIWIDRKVNSKSLVYCRHWVQSGHLHSAVPETRALALCPQPLAADPEAVWERNSLSI